MGWACLLPLVSSLLRREFLTNEPKRVTPTYIHRRRAVKSEPRRSGGAPPGIRRRKAGTDHRTVVADHGDGNTRRVPLRTAVEGVPREARKRRALPPPDRLERGLSSHGLTIAGY